MATEGINDSIFNQLEKVAEEICNSYCKVPLMEQYRLTDNNKDNWDNIQEKMFADYCDNCPLNKIL